MYHQNKMSMASPAYFEIIDFIAAGTTPEAVARFRPSLQAQQRVTDLIEREKDGQLTPDEKAETRSLHGTGAYPENGQGQGSPDPVSRPVISANNSEPK